MMPGASPERVLVGAYEPILQLATGGMATVFVARQLGAAGFERLVVLKRVHRHLLANQDFTAMLLDEAKVASLVRHPNVVPVIDVVQTGGELLLVMEYVESTALSTLARAARDAPRPVPAEIWTRIAVDTLAGLHAAHEATDMHGQPLEIVHRDVSPQNIIVGVDGTSRLIDFGVAKARHRISETKSGSLKGKYAYMAPEQAKAQAVDRRADLFALAVVLHESLTGARLFQGENEFDTMRRILDLKVPPPSTLRVGVPRAVDAVLLRALSRDPAARYRSALEFSVALEAAIRPASPRDVATWVWSLSGDRLARRRELLRDMLAGRRPPLQEASGAIPRDVGQSSPPTPSTRRPLAGVESTSSQIVATQDAVPPSRSRGRIAPWAWAMAICAVLAGLALAAGVVAVRRDDRDGRDVRAAAGAAATSAPPADTAKTAPSVSAAPPPTATGSQAATPEPPPTSSTPAPATSATTPPATKTTTRPAPRPPAPTATAAPPSELQSNPYGSP